MSKRLCSSTHPGAIGTRPQLEQVEAAAQATVDTFGSVHVICNNAGIGFGGRSETARMRNWHWVVDVNLWGVVHGLQAFVPRILSHGDGGHVVNTASIAGMFGFRGSGPYNATKFAVVGISETMMAEHRNDDLGVSVLCPGVVATNIGTSGRNRPSDYGGPVDPTSEGRSSLHLRIPHVAGLRDCFPRIGSTK